MTIKTEPSIVSFRAVTGAGETVYEVVSDSDAREGGAGIVYHVRQAGGVQPMALKLLKDTNPGMAAAELHGNRVVHESLVGIDTNKYGGVVALYGVYDGDADYLLVMQDYGAGAVEEPTRRAGILMNWIGYDSLAALQDKQTGDGSLLPIRELVDVFRSIARATQILHDADVTHGDLKPGNIFYDAGAKTVQLGDYTSCRPIRSFSQQQSDIPRVATPEFGESNAPQDIMYDIYSLGCILAWLCGGASHEPPANRILRKIHARCIAPRHERFTDIAALLEMLDEIGDTADLDPLQQALEEVRRGRLDDRVWGSVLRSWQQEAPARYDAACDALLDWTPPQQRYLVAGVSCSTQRPQLWSIDIDGDTPGEPLRVSSLPLARQWRPLGRFGAVRPLGDGNWLAAGSKGMIWRHDGHDRFAPLGFTSRHAVMKLQPLGNSRFLFWGTDRNAWGDYALGDKPQVRGEGAVAVHAGAAGIFAAVAGATNSNGRGEARRIVRLRPDDLRAEEEVTSVDELEEKLGVKLGRIRGLWSSSDGLVILFKTGLVRCPTDGSRPQWYRSRVAVRQGWPVEVLGRSGAVVMPAANTRDAHRGELVLLEAPRQEPWRALWRTVCNEFKDGTLIDVRPDVSRGVLIILQGAWTIPQRNRTNILLAFRCRSGERDETVLQLCVLDAAGQLYKVGGTQFLQGVVTRYSDLVSMDAAVAAQ